MAHEITYLEIIDSDPKRAADFYGQVFGWKIEAMGNEYYCFKAGDGADGGFSPPMPGISHGVCIYIKVEDIEAALAAVAAAGGECTAPKKDIGGGHGFYALFKDPHGNIIGLWSMS